MSQPFTEDLNTVPCWTCAHCMPRLCGTLRDTMQRVASEYRAEAFAKVHRSGMPFPPPYLSVFRGQAATQMYAMLAANKPQQLIGANAMQCAERRSVDLSERSTDLSCMQGGLECHNRVPTCPVLATQSLGTLPYHSRVGY